MAILYYPGGLPTPEVVIGEFFYGTPPRWEIPYLDVGESIEALLEGRCKYALIPEPLPKELPEGLEVKTVRSYFALLQRRGQVTRSDRCALNRRLASSDGPKAPYFWE